MNYIMAFLMATVVTLLFIFCVGILAGLASILWFSPETVEPIFETFLQWTILPFFIFSYLSWVDMNNRL